MRDNKLSTWVFCYFVFFFLNNVNLLFTRNKAFHRDLGPVYMDVGDPR